MYSYKNKHKDKVIIVTRFFNDQNLHNISAYYSKASLKELKDILNNKIYVIPGSNYILCPVYRNDKTGEYDFQIGISGSVKYKNNLKETYFEAISREIGEEVGLVVNMPYIPNKSIKKYIFNIEILKDVPKTYSNILINPNVDVMPKEKVYSIIHDSEINIDIYLKQKNIYRYKNYDRIVGIGKLRVSEIRKYLSKLFKQ